MWADPWHCGEPPKGHPSTQHFWTKRSHLRGDWLACPQPPFPGEVCNRGKCLGCHRIPLNKNIKTLYTLYCPCFEYHNLWTEKGYHQRLDILSCVHVISRIQLNTAVDLLSLTHHVVENTDRYCKITGSTSSRVHEMRPGRVERQLCASTSAPTPKSAAGAGAAAIATGQGSRPCGLPEKYSPKTASIGERATNWELTCKDVLNLFS